MAWSDDYANNEESKVYIPGFMEVEEAAAGEMGDRGTLLEISSSIVVGIAGASITINLRDYRYDD